MKTTSDPSAFEVVRLLARMRILNLDLYAVILNYLRYDEPERQRLKDAYSIIRRSLVPDALGSAFLWHGPSGTGKTFFAKTLASCLNVDYTEINLAHASGESARRALTSIGRKPAIVLLDEIDALLPEPWPMQVLFHVLSSRMTDSRRAPTVVIAAGSFGHGMLDFVRRVRTHPRGPDILNRIEPQRRFTFTPLTSLDAVVIFAACARAAARKLGKTIFEIEKLALAYAAFGDPELNTHRLSDLAETAVGRIPAGENRLKYSCLFDFYTDDAAPAFRNAWRRLEHQYIAIYPVGGR